MKKSKIRLGDRLVEADLISKNRLDLVLENQKETGRKLGEQIISEHLLSERQIFNFLEIQLGISHVDLSSYVIDSKAPKLIHRSLAEKYTMLPINIVKGKIILVMEDPMDIGVVDDVAMITGMPVEPVIASKDAIKKAIEIHYTLGNAVRKSEETDENDPDYSGMTRMTNDKSIANAPAVKLVDKIILSGIKAGASDIHIEPYETKVRIRFRIDGDLREYMTSTKSTHSPLVTRIKIMGKMDIAERRRPQDGRVETVIDSNAIDMRISILPTVHGEKVVIRLLNRSAVVANKKDLGFSEANLKRFDAILGATEGMILATGPTGSGKTTTLYSVLKELNTIEKNIITVEDPVEYRLDGVNQVQVNTKAGLTFATGLRSILRQDPDIVMVGEIRDHETAEIAVRASITGHVVLSTLHTNDTASTISRLNDMDVESFVLASSLVGIIAQRLVKKLCNSCKKTYILTDDEKEVMGVEENLEIKTKVGCSACGGTGYSGRTAIHEILIIDKEIRNLITHKSTTDEIKELAVKKGMLTLFDSCKDLVREGITSFDELMRVTYSVE